MIDFNKFVKYSKAGPRYTSYPTAIEFNDKYRYEEYLDDIKKSNSSGNRLSLYIHIPFCRSACYFCGCNVVYTSKEEKKVTYIEYLKKELNILRNYLDTNRVVHQMHFGGGTPTFLSAQQLDEVISSVREVFPNFSDDAEISCEVDPRFFNKDQMRVLRDGGFNRISFGAQDFDANVQEATHRIQSVELSKEAVDIARIFDIKSVNIDLIYGLPHQSLESFKHTLEQTVAMNPDRLAVFNYAHVPWMKKSMRKIDETTLPEPSVKLEILKYSIDFLTSNGYKMIGMDHFAKPSDELFKATQNGEIHRNFQGYTTKGNSDFFGIGVTSIGEGKDWYAQNVKDLKKYEEIIDSGELPFGIGIKLTDDDILRKKVIMHLMSNFNLEFKTIEDEFGINFREYFKDALTQLKPYIDDELIVVDDTKIDISETGKLLIRNLVFPFDAYSNKIPLDQMRFSKTV